jgi:hypothetical protein
MENADRSKEVWPRTERILFFQVFPNLKMLHESNPHDKKKPNKLIASLSCLGI